MQLAFGIVRTEMNTFDGPPKCMSQCAHLKHYSLLLCGLFYQATCFMSYLVSFCSCVSVLLTLRLPRLEKRHLILVLFVRLFDLCFLALLVSSSSWCLGRAKVCDCGTPWAFLLSFICILFQIKECLFDNILLYSQFL